MKKQQRRIETFELKTDFKAQRQSVDDKTYHLERVNKELKK